MSTGKHSNLIYFDAVVGFPTTKRAKKYKKFPNRSKNNRHFFWNPLNLQPIWIHKSGQEKNNQNLNTKKSWSLKRKFAVWCSGAQGPSEDLWGPRKDLLWPKRALFASFWSFSQTGWFYMDYNNAGWAEHSDTILWTPHKPIFWEKNSHTKLARGNLGLTDISGQMGPF